MAHKRDATPQKPRAARLALVGASSAAAILVIVGLLAMGVFAPPGVVVQAKPSSQVPQKLRVRVLRTLPHDRKAFTQGFLLSDGQFYESTGLYRQSDLRMLSQSTGAVQRLRENPPEVFSEGLAKVGDTLVQLTWKAGRAFVWDARTFELKKEFSYRGEGWGLCFDGSNLVMSDGSDKLTLRDVQTFRAKRRIRVRDRGRPVSQLNELECVGGKVYANVWQTDRIVRIDMPSGVVSGIVDASGLLSPAQAQGVDVLNGIAWDEESQTFFLTGKLWPKIFEVTFEPQSRSAQRE